MDNAKYVSPVLKVFAKIIKGVLQHVLVKYFFIHNLDDINTIITLQK